MAAVAARRILPNAIVKPVITATTVDKLVPKNVITGLKTEPIIFAIFITTVAALVTSATKACKSLACLAIAGSLAAMFNPSSLACSAATFCVAA